jgi:hypothetical protein
VPDQVRCDGPGNRPVPGQAVVISGVAWEPGIVPVLFEVRMSRRLNDSCWAGFYRLS